MRWKFSSQNSESSMYTCCWCFHVRTGTVCFGIFCLVVEVVGLILMGIVAANPSAVEKFGFHDINVDPLVDDKIGAMIKLRDNSSHDKVDQHKLYFETRNRNWNEDDNFVSVLLIGGCILATIMLIMGTIKAKPSHMIPFMAIQVFHFCITSLTVISYFSYVPNVKNWIRVQPEFKHKDDLLKLDDDWLMLSVVLFSVTILVVEAYLIGIVWSCYKYICQLQAAERAAALYSLQEACYSGNPEDAEMLLPPKYEDIAQLPANTHQPVPPPAYED